MNPDYSLQPSSRVKDAYSRNHAAAMHLINLVREGVENCPAPESGVNINWAHVGSLSHVNEQLQEIVRFLNADEFPTP